MTGESVKTAVLQSQAGGQHMRDSKQHKMRAAAAAAAAAAATQDGNNELERCLVEVRSSSL